MLLSLRDFTGIAPRIDPMEESPFSQDATNCKLYSGDLRSWSKPSFTLKPRKIGPLETLFLYRGQYWFQWRTDVDVVLSPIKGDVTDTVYFTGDGPPKITDSSVATGADAGDLTELPKVTYTLGVPTPTATPSVAVNGASTDPSTAVPRAYIYTIVLNFNGKLMDSAPSFASQQVDVEDTQTVTISGMQTSVSGNYPVSGATKRIYRTESGSEYLFVAEVPLTQSNYTDSMTPLQLGNAITSTNFDPPDPNMQGLVSLANGILAGFVDNKILFSEPFIPHAWPADYTLATEYPIVGLGAYGNSLVVCTEQDTYVVTGSSPQAMSMIKLGVKLACISKRSIVQTGDSVLYASRNGLVQVRGREAFLVTRDLFTRDDWGDVDPFNLISAYHEDRYFGFSPALSFMIDFRELNKGIIPLDLSAETGVNEPFTAYVYPVNDTLYLYFGDSIYEWEASPDPMDFTYRSRIYITDKPENLAVGQVQASVFPVRVEVFADGVKRFDRMIYDDKAFRMPGGYTAKRWEIQLSGNGQVRRVDLASSVHELAEV